MEEKGKDFMDEIQEDAVAQGMSSGTNASGLNFKQEGKGTYRMRLLTKPVGLYTHFFGPGVPSVVCVGKDKGCKFHSTDYDEPSLSLHAYVLDRRDGVVKMADLTKSIGIAIQNLKRDEDYSFTEWPMPYDIKVVYDPRNPDPKAKYQVTPSPQRVEITEEEKVKLDEKMKRRTPQQYVDSRRTKQAEKDLAASTGGTAPAAKSSEIEYPAEDINPDDIPF